jgi:hypothetical protein
MREELGLSYSGASAAGRGARPGGIRGRWGRLIFTGKLIPCQIPRDSGLSVARETSALKTKDLPRLVADIAVRPLVVGHPTGSCTGRSRSLWPRSGAEAYLHDQWSYSHRKRNDNWSPSIRGFAGENRWERPGEVSVRQRQCVAPWLVVPDNYEQVMSSTR